MPSAPAAGGGLLLKPVTRILMPHSANPSHAPRRRRRSPPGTRVTRPAARRALRRATPWLALAASLLAASASAQAADGAELPDARRSTLAPVVVTGNPLRDGDGSVPASVLDGEALRERRASTLGATLDGLPGVANTGYGPNAGRPVIRGQDGDRIRILGNGGASLDASSLSFDHAVPIEPLVVQRIEVLRGPAALLYGGSAVGGVVNAIDNRIPREAVGPLGGAVELRAGGSAGERSGSLSLDTGGDAETGQGLVFHVDAFGRKTDDLRVPAFGRPVEGGVERRTRVENSASSAKGGALGLSRVWADGHLGASVDTYDNDYGVVVEEGVTIRMRRQQFALDGESRQHEGPIRAVRGRLQFSDYEHEEVEGSGEVGTRFENRGADGRLELEHAPVSWGPGELRGVFGLQAERSRFSALGEEAFVPATRTEQAALFAHERYALGGWQWSLGARVERTRVRSEGDAGADEPRFGEAQSRRFTASSLALGATWPLAEGWSGRANLAYTERAPTFYELYANGVHLATATFERGDDRLRKERGEQLDLGVQWQRGANRLALSAYAGRYRDYIALLRTGEPDVETEEGEAVPVRAFSAVPARLHGVELEGAWRAFEGPWTLDLDGNLDVARGSRRDTGEPLPRLAPLRWRVGARAGWGAWQALLQWRHAARQTRVSLGDTPTDGWDLVDVGLERRFTAPAWLGADASLHWFVRVENVGNALAYNATSVETVRWLSPQGRRAVSTGLRLDL